MTGFSIIKSEPNNYKVILSSSSSLSLSSSSSSSSLLMTLDGNNIVEERVQLSTGIHAQILSWEQSTSTTTSSDLQLPPLYFLHGSFHGAWCWTEKYFPYFASLGYPELAAFSWRGTGGTFAGEGVKKVTILQHVYDLDAFLSNRLVEKTTEQQQQLQPMRRRQQRPIVIAHSFGGLAVMKYLELFPQKANELLGGVIMMCSVPPSGNDKVTLRYMKRSLVDSYKITMGFAMKQCITNENLCRELFFGGKKVKQKLVDDNGKEVIQEDDHGVSDEDIQRYQKNFARDSKATIDLFDLKDKLPSLKTTNGCAPFLLNSSLNPDENYCCRLRFHVIGATDDFIVDREAVEETGKYFGLLNNNDNNEGGVSFVNSPHDIMLGKNWKNGATSIHNWIKKL